MNIATKRALLAGVLMSLTSIATQVSADGDVAAGKAKAGGCAACHGAKGVAVIRTHPSLAGQNALYLVSALKAYKTKQRSNGQAIIMQAQAAMLSEEDMNDLAAYFASLPAGG